MSDAGILLWRAKSGGGESLSQAGAGAPKQTLPSPQNFSQLRVPGVGVEPLARLQSRKLFITRSDKSGKTDKNA
jgi:hypothetical protein